MIAGYADSVATGFPDESGRTLLRSAPIGYRSRLTSSRDFHRRTAYTPNHGTNTLSIRCGSGGGRRRIHLRIRPVHHRRRQPLPEGRVRLEPFWLGFAVSSAVIGCIIGPLVGGGLTDRWGRKKALVFCAVLFGISAIGTALPRTMTEFYIFRIVGGIGVGLASIISPMYIAEVAPARMRGRLVLVNQVAIVVGSLSSIIVSYYLSLIGSWRWMFASEMVPIVILLIGLAFVPESPRWFAQVNRKKEAREVLTRIGGKCVRHGGAGGDRPVAEGEAGELPRSGQAGHEDRAAHCLDLGRSSAIERDQSAAVPHSAHLSAGGLREHLRCHPAVHHRQRLEPEPGPASDSGPSIATAGARC